MAVQESFLDLARLFSPQEAVGQRKLRLGGPNDGGYVMLDDFAGVTSAFSFGIADEASPGSRNRKPRNPNISV